MKKIIKPQAKPIPQQKRWSKFYDKLSDLIEEEIVLATGNKSKKHFSGDCRMNEIFELIEKYRDKELAGQEKELIGRIEKIKIPIMKEESFRSLPNLKGIWYAGFSSAKRTILEVIKQKIYRN